MSKYPRTDAARLKDVCRHMAMAEECTRMEYELNEAKARIKRMEEAGDALCKNSNPSRWDSPADAARKLTVQSNWRKAKEAKP